MVRVRFVCGVIGMRIEVRKHYVAVKARPTLAKQVQHVEQRKDTRARLVDAARDIRHTDTSSLATGLLMKRIRDLNR